VIVVLADLAVGTQVAELQAGVGGEGGGGGGDGTRALVFEGMLEGSP